jgi:hypothetical protein
MFHSWILCREKKTSTIFDDLDDDDSALFGDKAPAKTSAKKTPRKSAVAAKKKSAPRKSKDVKSSLFDSDVSVGGACRRAPRRGLVPLTLCFS